MNFFDLFFDPKKAATDAFENPNFALIAGLVILGPVLSVLISMLFGLPVQIIQILLFAVSSFVSILVLSALFYLAIYLFSFKEKIKGKFWNLVQANALVYVYLGISMAMFLPFFLVAPDISKPISEFGTGIITEEQFIVDLQLLSANWNANLINAITIVTGAVFVLMSLYQLYLWFVNFKFASKLSTFRSIIFYAVLLAIFSIVMHFLSFLGI